MIRNTLFTLLVIIGIPFAIVGLSFGFIGALFIESACRIKDVEND